MGVVSFARAELQPLLSEFPQSQSELSHRLAFGPVSGPQQLRHCRLLTGPLPVWDFNSSHSASSRSRTEIWTARDHDRKSIRMRHSVCQRIHCPTPPPSNGQQFSSTRSPINSVGQMGRQTDIIEMVVFDLLERRGEHVSSTVWLS